MVTLTEVLEISVSTVAPVAPSKLTVNCSMDSSISSSTAVRTNEPLGLPALIVSLPSVRFEEKSAPSAPSKVVPLEFASANERSTTVSESEIADENSTTKRLCDLFSLLCHKPLVCKYPASLFQFSSLCQESDQFS